jgi:hypothetical protein
MPLLAELGILVERKLQICRAYGAPLRTMNPKAQVIVPEYKQVMEI